jgi:sulfur-oxidizing protein SoxZ
MAKDVKIRAKMKGEDVVAVKTGKKIPAHYITEVDCQHNGETVMTAYWGPSVSKNPYLSFEFKGGKPGDTVTISWVDNKGDSGSGEATIK